jgi:hypothetical protein
MAKLYERIMNFFLIEREQRLRKVESLAQSCTVNKQESQARILV